MRWVGAYLGLGMIKRFLDDRLKAVKHTHLKLGDPAWWMTARWPSGSSPPLPSISAATDLVSASSGCSQHRRGEWKGYMIYASLSGIRNSQSNWANAGVSCRIQIDGWNDDSVR